MTWKNLFKNCSTGGAHEIRCWQYNAECRKHRKSTLLSLIWLWVLRVCMNATWIIRIYSMVTDLTLWIQWFKLVGWLNSSPCFWTSLSTSLLFFLNKLNKASFLTCDSVVKYLVLKTFMNHHIAYCCHDEEHWTFFALKLSQFSWQVSFSLYPSLFWIYAIKWAIHCCVFLADPTRWWYPVASRVEASSHSSDFSHFTLHQWHSNSVTSHVPKPRALVNYICGPQHKNVAHLVHKNFSLRR